MADEKKIAQAKTVYNTLCMALEKMNWIYTKEEEKLLVRFSVSGEDIPMKFVCFIDIDRQLVRLMSFLPFRFDENKRAEGAVVTCGATYTLVDGSFDFNIDDGSVFFRMTSSFRESLIGEGMILYMISYACGAVDAFNDKFFAVSKGALSIEDFLSQL